jgi:hypothetical protein
VVFCQIGQGLESILGFLRQHYSNIGKKWKVNRVGAKML